MGVSQDDRRPAGGWSRPACSVILARKGECFGAVGFDSLGSEQMTRLTGISVSPDPILRRLASRRRAVQGNCRRNCSFSCPHRRNWLKTVPEVSKLPNKVELVHSRLWRSFSPVLYLPPLDAELFKEYSVCGHGGLMSAEVSKLLNKGEFVVFNPLTGQTRALPPLLHPRNPVLVHISVDPAEKSYKVIVAGSSAASDEHVSKKVEVFDSSTSKWKEACDLPGPAFGLNEHQAGVSLDGKLYLISFLEGGGRGLVAFDLENGTWLQDLTTPIPWSSYSNTVQLVESDGKLFLFSEQQRDHSVDHCIDELELLNPEAGVLACRWTTFVKVRKSNGRGLQVYPEQTCVGFGEEKLGIFHRLSKKLIAFTLDARFFGMSCYAGPAMKLSFLLSCLINLPMGARAEEHSMDSMSSMLVSSIAWESTDFAKAVAGTILVGVTIVGAKYAWGFFCRGNQFDIDGGLENSPIPTRGNLLFATPPEL